MKPVPQEKLERFEKSQRALLWWGRVSVALVLVSWILMALMSQKVMDLLMRPDPGVTVLIHRLDTMILETPQEKVLAGLLRGLMLMPIVILRIFLIKSIQILILTCGLLMIGFARHQKKLIDFVKEGANEP